MTVRHYVDLAGNYLGAWDSGTEQPHPDAPTNAVAVPVAPGDARQIWNGSEWGPVPPVLAPLSPRQIRLVLAAQGLLATAEAALDALEEPVRSQALIEWEYATEFQRDNPLLLQVADALDLTDEQIDTLWLAGMAL